MIQNLFKLVTWWIPTRLDRNNSVSLFRPWQIYSPSWSYRANQVGGSVFQQMVCCW